MKKILLASILSFSSAFGMVRNPVEPLEISFDGEVIKGRYLIGGGCQEHTPEIAIEGTKISNSKSELTITVIDTSPGMDHCEALISKDFELNITAKLNSVLEEIGASRWYARVVLPTVRLRGN